MRILLLLMFSIVLLGSCSSEKKLLTEKTKYNWDISYVQSEDFTDNDLIVKSKLKVVNQEPKENKLFASSEKIIKSHLLNDLETDLEKINKSLYKDLLVNNKKCESDEIEKSDNEDRDGFILNLIGVSFLVLITGLDVFLALFSIAFDGFYGVSLIFFFSSLIRADRDRKKESSDVRTVHPTEIVAILVRYMRRDTDFKEKMVLRRVRRLRCAR